MASELDQRKQQATAERQHKPAAKPEFAILSDRELARRGQKVVLAGVAVLCVIALLVVALTVYHRVAAPTSGPLHIAASQRTTTGVSTSRGSPSGSGASTRTRGETALFAPSFATPRKKLSRRRHPGRMPASMEDGKPREW